MNERPIEIATGADPVGAVIWLHGLGADGHDFEPLVPELQRLHHLSLRFVFPHAPIRPVTINGGMPMRAWYDISSFDRNSKLDVAGISASDAALRALVEREQQRGISTERIVLAGFSQGGAMALYTGLRLDSRLAGIVALSSYLLASESLAAEQHAMNQHTPIFLAHGRHDPILPYSLGEQTRVALVAAGHAVDWHSYQMEHSLCAPEVADIASFLARVFKPR